MKKPKFFLIPPLILALCLTLCVALAAATDTPEVVASGECGADGDNVTWTLDGDGTLTISGTGNMKNYDVMISNYFAPWYTHHSSIYRVIINDGVTCIGSSAFRYCTNLVDITIPESVSRIKDHAFYHCTSLTKISIPGSVINLDDDAFLYCTSLVDVTICDGVKVIGASAFDDCEKLENITIPSSVYTIGNGAFHKCTSLRMVTLPEGLQFIGGRAFSYCTGLTNISIPSTVLLIGTSTSRDGKPHNSTNPFGGCASLDYIEVTPENTRYCSVDGVVFLKDQSELICYPAGNATTSYAIPDGVEKIDSDAFYGCLNLSNVSIPESVTSIGESAFSGCDGLTNMTIPDSVTSIGGNAFYGCNGLTNMTIPDSVKTIGSFAFSNCTSLADVSLSVNLKTITYGLFLNCAGLTRIEIPNGVTSIAQSAFSGCSGMKEVTIPDSVKKIEVSAFSNCVGLTELKLPDSLETLSGFNGCVGLRNITIPSNVTKIDRAFSGCTALTEITIPSSVNEIPNNTFDDCYNLKNIYYAGSESQWNEIVIGKLGNAPILFYADIYYNGSHEIVGRDSRTMPIIALTYAPAYNENRPFQGIVFKRDGSAFDLSEYRVALWLYYSGYYPKPTYDKPYTDISSDGSFTTVYNTGGYDLHSETLYFMLIPSDYTPTTFDDTREHALDYVKVTRTKEGEVTVMPNREPSESPVAPAIPSGLLPVARDKIAVDVGFYTNGGSPGSALSADLIRRQLDAVSKFSDTVRFYGSAGELAKAYKTAHDMGFAVLGNAWLSKDKAANQTELDALIEHCNNGYCKIAIVGSEVLLRGDLTAGELIEAIEYVRERLTDKTIPVTTADSVDILIAAPSVRNACNLLMPNCYPYWGGSSIEQAAGHFIENMEALDAVRGEKEILVSETGWPTAGQGKDNAKAGETEAAQYYSAIREWSLSSNTQVLFFDATDEPWKTKDEGESGAHWGFMTTDFVLKDCYKNLNPFQEKYAIKYVSGNATSATASLTNNTGAVAEICYAVAAYNTNGRMISCNMVSKSMGVSESVSLAVSYSESDAVTQIKAFVLDANTFAPLQGAWAKNSE